MDNENTGQQGQVGNVVGGDSMQGYQDAPDLDSIIQRMNAGPDALQRQEQETQLQQEPQQEEIENSGQGVNAEAFERIQKMELDLYRQRQELKREREEWQREREQNSSNYDDFQKTLDELLMSDEEREQVKTKDTQQQLNPDEMRKSIREEILAEINKQKESERAELETKRVEQDYLNECRGFTQSNSDKFPLVSGLGKESMMYDALVATYNENARLYGEDRAGEMLPSLEDVAHHVEKVLADELQVMLKSDVVRGYIGKLVNGNANSNPFNSQSQSSSTQSQGQNNTLTNNGFTQHSSGETDNRNLSDEEALQRAMKLIL